MRRILTVAVFVVVLIVASHPMMAASVGQTPSGSTSGAPSIATSPSRQPFKNLFGASLLPQGTPAQRPAFPSRPLPPGPSSEVRVVCGMTLIPTDPTVDRAIRRVVPDASRRFAIVAVPPPPCESAEGTTSSPPRR